MLPSPDTCAKKRQKQAVVEGDCVEMYERIKLYNSLHKEIVGQIMCDKMKLKGDIYFNASNNEIVGVSEDFISEKKILKNLLDSDSIDESWQPAVYVNQWRFRSVNGKTYNLEFFYNTGHLTADELLEQY